MIDIRISFKFFNLLLERYKLHLNFIQGVTIEVLASF